MPINESATQQPTHAMSSSAAKAGSSSSAAASSSSAAASSSSTGAAAASAAAASSAAVSGLGTSMRQQNGQTNFKHRATGIEINLQNIVATVNLKAKLNLKDIALRVRNAEYNPQRFAAVIMRVREPKATALVFASGKMVVTGVKSEFDSKTAARKFAKTIFKLGNPLVKTHEYKVQNIVGTLDCGFAIRLESLAYAHGKFASYEPELFPGLIFRMIKPKVVVLIFVSGKCVITGGKYEQDIYEAFDKIYAVLLEFKKSPQIAV